jgi:hypothetical protein
MFDYGEVGVLTQGTTRAARDGVQQSIGSNISISGQEK